MKGTADTGAKLRSYYDTEGGVKAAFTSKVSDYVASRPGYPEALFEALKELCPPTAEVTVADVGAGTGLLPRGLLRHGYSVVAIEPNVKMRRVSDDLLANTAGYHSVSGCAESMPLPAGSIQLITAAQAFHWFEVDRTRAEFLRVLTPQGQVALIWNDRVLDDPLHVELDGVFTQFGGAKRSALVAHENRDGVRSFFGLIPPLQFSWPYVHDLNKPGLLSLVFSRSYIPSRDTKAGQEIENRMNLLFRHFNTNGVVAVRYRTVVMLGRSSV